MLSLRHCLQLSTPSLRLYETNPEVYLTAQGKETETAIKKTEEFAEELANLRQTLTYPDRASVKMEAYKVTAGDADGLIAVLQRNMPQHFANVNAVKAAYVNMSREARSKTPPQNINLIRPGDTLSAENGVLTVTRSGGGSFTVNIFPWDAVPAPAPEATKPAPEATKPAPEATKPAPEATKPAPEATKPAPEATKPAPEATKPAPEATKPAPEATKPAPEATKPAPEATKPAPEATKPAPEAGELVDENRDVNLRREWEEDVKPALLALEQTYPGVKVRIRDAAFTPVKDKLTDEADAWPNYGKHGKTIELVGEDGHVERFQILVPRKAESYFDDSVSLSRDGDRSALNVNWEKVQNDMGLTAFFTQEAEELFASEKLSTLLPADIQALEQLPPDRQIHYFSGLVLQYVKLVNKDPKAWNKQDRTALGQLYNGGLLENMTAWHQDLSARTDLTPAMKDNLASINTHLTYFRTHRPSVEAEAPQANPETSGEKSAESYYGDYQTAMTAGDIMTAREALREAKKHAKDGSLEGVDVKALLEKIEQDYSRVVLQLNPGEKVTFSAEASPEMQTLMTYVNAQLSANNGRFEGLLPHLKQYTVSNATGGQVRSFYVNPGATTRVK